VEGAISPVIGYTIVALVFTYGVLVMTITVREFIRGYKRHMKTERATKKEKSNIENPTYLKSSIYVYDKAGKVVNLDDHRSKH
jgi:hypothetical protein